MATKAKSKEQLEEELKQFLETVGPHLTDELGPFPNIQAASRKLKISPHLIRRRIREGWVIDANEKWKKRQT